MIASVLLGMSPPTLSSGHLVAAGALFGISEGAVRVAITRMTQAGELTATNGRYELAGVLLERHGRQRDSRAQPSEPWSGSWVLLVVRSGGRDAHHRLELRDATSALHFGELREGVWIRPDNLPRTRLPEAWAVICDQCRLLGTDPEQPSELVEELWNPRAWAARATELRRTMEPFVPRLAAGDASCLVEAFEVAAAVVRHLLADPQLPKDLLPSAWPGAALRSEYDAYERAFQELWRSFFATLPGARR